MTRRLLGCVLALVFLAPVASGQFVQQTTNIGGVGIKSTTGREVRAGDETNTAVRVNVVAGTVSIGGMISNVIMDGSAPGQADVIGSAPGGTEQGLVVRNIPSGTQPVSGTVSAAQSGAWTNACTQSGAWTVGATQSGTWTVQPGNTANTTPWLQTISQGGNSATVSAAGALKVDGSAVTQPVSGTVTSNQGTGGASAWKVDGSAVTQPVSGTITANQGGAPWSTNVTQLAGTSVLNGGTAGSLAIGSPVIIGTVLAGQQNPVVIGGRSASSGSQPPTAGNGSLQQLTLAGDGVLFTRPGGPVHWSCTLTGVGIVQTQCQAAPGANLVLYLTSASYQSSAGNPGFQIVAGTGVACAVGLAAIYPGLPATSWNTGTLLAQVTWTIPLQTATNSALCVVGSSAVQTIQIQLTGFTAP